MSIMSMLVAGGGAFTPLSLFASGEQGAWYDPSNLATMFEDTAGTTPVHTPGNGTADSPVGLLLDNHTGSVGTNGAYRYNKVSYSEDFSNAWWYLYNATISSTSVTSPTGTSNASTVNFPSTGSLIRPNSVSSVPWVSGTNGTWQIWAKKSASGGANYIRLTTNNTGAWNTGISTRFALTTSWQLLTVTGVLETGNSYLNTIIGTYDETGTNDSTCGGNVDIWGAQVAVSGAPSAYQKITSDWVSTMTGNHATQSTGTARPTLSAKYNQLLYTEQFDNGYYTKDFMNAFGSGSVANATTAPDGTVTADYLQEDTANNYHRWYRQNTFTSGAATTLSICAKAKERNWFSLNIQDNNGNHYCWFDVTNGVVGTVASGATASITSLGSGWYRCSMTVTLNGTSPYLEMRLATGDGVLSYQGTGTSGMYFWGMDWRYTNDGVGLPAYQRVVDANTYDSTGFPYYLKSDGVDDMLQCSDSAMPTGNLSVFSGSRCNVDFAGQDYRAIFGYGQAATGKYIFYMYTTDNSSGTTNGMGVSQYGSTVGINNLTNKRVVLSFNRISSDYYLRSQGGASSATKNMTTATALYGANGLGICANGAGSPGAYLNGRIYGIIIRGVNSTATEISNAETWMNTKTLAY